MKIRGVKTWACPEESMVEMFKNVGLSRRETQEFDKTGFGDKKEQWNYFVKTIVERMPRFGATPPN